MSKKALAAAITMAVVLTVGLVAYVLIGRKMFPPLTSSTAPMRADDTGVTPATKAAVIAANNRFALKLYSKLNSGGDNVFFSPYSISTALAMTYEGARGKTAAEMAEVFGFPADETVRRPAFAAIYNDINRADSRYKLYTANALWAQKDYKFSKDYLATVRQYYAGKATGLDFAGDTEGSRKIINQWVEAQTHNKIVDLIPRRGLIQNTRLVLTNAIYFKGDWLTEFDKTLTEDADFKVSAKETVKAPMMRFAYNAPKQNYAETDDMQILELPYQGDELSMLLLLPKRGDVETLDQSLKPAKIAVWRRLLRKTPVRVSMPKFRLEQGYDLKPQLQSLGMPTAFSGAADFSGMTGDQTLFISAVRHKAYVDVNEKGTEAAAATDVEMQFKGLPAYQKVFQADHPFLFLIQEKAGGNILFIGKLSRPE